MLWGEVVPPFSNSKKHSRARCFFGRFYKSGADIFGCLDFEMRKWAFSNALRNDFVGKSSEKMVGTRIPLAAPALDLFSVPFSLSD